MHFDHRWLATLILLSLPVSALAQGGPPMITDDPDTPGPGYWEINLAGITEKSQSERRYEAPTADINYGVGKRIQLKFEIPWVGSSFAPSLECLRQSRVWFRSWCERIRLRILSNCSHVTHSFDIYDREEMKINLSA
jgi:hypothetical protein